MPTSRVLIPLAGLQGFDGAINVFPRHFLWPVPIAGPLRAGAQGAKRGESGPDSSLSERRSTLLGSSHDGHVSTGMVFAQKRSPHSSMR